MSSAPVLLAYDSYDYVLFMEDFISSSWVRMSDWGVV